MWDVVAVLGLLVAAAVAIYLAGRSSGVKAGEGERQVLADELEDVEADVAELERAGHAGSAASAAVLARLRARLAAPRTRGGARLLLRGAAQRPPAPPAGGRTDAGGAGGPRA